MLQTFFTFPRAYPTCGHIQGAATTSSPELPKGEDAVHSHRHAGTPPAGLTAAWKTPVFPKSQIATCS